MSAFPPLTIANMLLGVMADRKPRDLNAMAEATGGSADAVSRAVRRLREAAFLRTTRPGCYALTAKGKRAFEEGEEITAKKRQWAQPKRDSVRSRAWRAMRMRRSFTVAELVCDVRRGDASSKSAIQHFCTELARAGYLQGAFERGHNRLKSNGKRYRLRKDTGPLPPSYRTATRTLHDFNTGEDIQLPESEVACRT